MTETQAKWAVRVSEWRQSGKSAEEFAEGRGFEGSTLRYWSSRLKHGTDTVPPETPPVRMARVVRRSKLAADATTKATAEAGIVVEVGAARVTVRRGFDRLLLRELIESLQGER